MLKKYLEIYIYIYIYIMQLLKMIKNDFLINEELGLTEKLNSHNVTN